MRSLSVCGLVLLVSVVALLPGCNALKELCGNTRPVPVIASISPSSIPFSQVSSSFSLVVSGSQFVSASVVVFSGATLATTVNSVTQLTVTLNSSTIPGAGTYKVSVHTPGGTSGELGCDSGGDSATLILTVT
jgi:hypothetical protein